ncbi:MAG: cyclic nucleotide-binding domain-containing protein [Chloroflexota bacterium]
MPTAATRTVGSRIRSAANIRDDEVAVIRLIALVFAALEMGRGIGEVGVNTLVLSRLPADALPWLYIPLGLISLVIAVAFGAALGRIAKARLFGITLVVMGVLLVAEFVLLAAVPDMVPIAWLTVMAAGTIAATITWTVATSSLDVRQAKRLFPICTAAAIAGYLAGSLLAGPVAGTLGAAALIGIQGILFAVAAALIARLASRHTGGRWIPQRTAHRSIAADVRVGFDEVRASPLLRLVAVAYVLLAILLFSVSFPYLRAARAAYPDEAELARILGIIAATITAISFVVSLGLADRFYRRFGIAGAALLLPLVYLGGFAVWIVSFTFVTAAAFTIVQQVTQRGISNAAWSATYNVLPSTHRAQAIAFMDGVPGQIGTVLVGVLLLLSTSLLAPDQVFLLGFVAAAACVVVVVAVRRRYANALLHTLRSGVGEQILEGGRGLGDLLAAPDVRAALIGALRGSDAGTRQMAAELLARSPEQDARRALAAALDDGTPAVRGAAAGAILGSRASGHAADADEAARAEATLAALAEGDIPARVAGLDAGRRLGRPLEGEHLRTAAVDPAPEVRAAVMTAIGDLATGEAADALLAGLHDPSVRVRTAAAATLASRAEVDPRVVDLLGASDGMTTEAAAIAALAGHGEAVRDRIDPWADREVNRAIELSQARAILRAGGGGAADPDADFLCAILDHRIRHAETMALAAMTALGAPAAGGVIRRSLGSSDPDVRAQAIEALDSIGDRRLGRTVARLIEEPPTGVSENVATVLGRLRDDDDEWIGTMARRLQPTGDELTDTGRVTADIATMLQLRRVPLFQQLSPEDLQRIASVAVERWFDEGAALVREGEPGDELFVIVEGRVRVVHRADDGTERTLRTYGEGDHIGELAVLRAQPRVATVVADGGSVRTLVIGGDGLTMILRERPDAAMAMLATLAERLSTQT